MAISKKEMERLEKALQKAIKEDKGVAVIPKDVEFVKEDRQKPKSKTKRK